MDATTKSKWQVRLAVILIFVLGFAAGALALNGYRRWGRGAEGNRGGFQSMLNRLQLTDQQKPQVEQILNETREQLQSLRKESEPRVAEIRRLADERLQKVLTAEQWKQFQEEREKRRGRGRRGRDNSPDTP